MAGCGPNESHNVATMAAPVGVTSSCCTPFEKVGAPCNSLAVAGAGTGNTPWAIFAVPPPTFSGEHAKRSMPSALKPMHDADDVHNGIDGADFVEMNLFEWRVVNVRFGLAKFLKNARSAFSNLRSELRIRQNFKNGARGSMLLLVFGLDTLDASGGHAIFPDLLGGERPACQHC